MMSTTVADKWNRIYAAKDATQTKAAKVLEENLHLLPDSGTALDLACGLGANALLLAQHGLQTSAWDIADTAVEQLNHKAKALNLSLQVQARDVLAKPPAAASFDVIVVSYYLERSLMPQLSAALKKNGLLFYQTFIAEQATAGGPRNPLFRLERNELLHCFPDLQILHYREDALVGDLSRGFRNEALLVGRNSNRHG